MQPNRGWIWFFVALVLLSAAAITINWLYNARQRLTPEQLRAAQDRWDREGPRDYDLVIEKTIGSPEGGDGKNQDRITVVVNGAVVNECFDVFPSKGKILLESEGFEVYFRRFELRPLTRSG